MSKYTTEVRFICETEAGYTESKGFNSIDNILDIAAPKIFNFDFPIFDENYRLPLEKKILRHYYTREISEETVGLWKLRLQDRLCMIMPYYNKLYESELLEFNPLYDVDYTRQHTGESEGNEDRTQDVTGDISATTDHSHTQVENSTKDRTDEATTTINKIGKSTDSGSQTTETTKSLEKTDDATTTTNTVGNTTDSGSERVSTTKTMIGNVTESGTEETDTGIETTEEEDNSYRSTTQHTLDRTFTERENKDKRMDETTNTDLTHGKTVITTPGVKIRETTNGTKWDMHSDTPQGGLNGIISDDYLTDVHKIIDDNLITVREPIDGGYDAEANSGTDHTYNHFEGSNVEHNGKSGEEHLTKDQTVKTDTEDKNKTVTSGSEETTTFGKVVDSSEDETGSVTTTFGKVVDKTETQTTDYDNTTTEASEGTDEITFGKIVDTSETTATNFEETENESGNVTTNTIGKDELTRTEETNLTGNTHITNTNEYLEHVVGKQGSFTYSKMLLEFRDTFLNIDKMVIDDLSLCFFGLW